MKTWKKWVIGILSLLFISITFIGWLHTPSARQYPWARRVLMSMMGVCPLDKKMNAEVSDRERRKALVQMSGSRPSPTLNFVGFQLGSDTVLEMKSWAEKNSATCGQPLKSIRLWKCDDGKKVTSFQFNTNGKLVSVDSYQQKVEALEANQRFQSRIAQLQKTLGDPDRKEGEVNFAGDRPKTFFLQYRFKNAVAQLTATRFSFTGIVLHEQYSLVE